MICSIQRLRIEIGQYTLCDLPATILEGQCCVFYGSSGIGKSTFLKSLTCGSMTNSTSDSINVSKQLTFNPAIQSMYYVPQHLPRFNLTVCSFFSHIHKIYCSDGSCTDTLNRIVVEFGLEDILNRNMNRVSGGQLQRIYLTSALASSAHLLLLDEPSATLDKNNRAIFLRLLKQYIDKKNGFVICTTHDPIFGEQSTLDHRWHALDFPSCSPRSLVLPSYG